MSNEEWIKRIGGLCFLIFAVVAVLFFISPDSFKQKQEQQNAISDVLNAGPLDTTTIIQEGGQKDLRINPEIYPVMGLNAGDRAGLIKALWADLNAAQKDDQSLPENDPRGFAIFYDVVPYLGVTIVQLMLDDYVKNPKLGKDELFLARIQLAAAYEHFPPPDEAPEADWDAVAKEVSQKPYARACRAGVISYSPFLEIVPKMGYPAGYYLLEQYGLLGEE